MSDIKYSMEVSNLKKSFGSNHIIKDISFKIQPGKSLVIIGGSGSGKSVLIKTIAGLICADSGQVIINGCDYFNSKEQNKKAIMEQIAFLFQAGALFDSLTVWENVAFAIMQNHNIKRKEAYQIAVNNLGLVGLKESTAKLYPADLSGGMKKRVSIAAAITRINPPKIFLLDEPTSGLDPIMSGVIYKLIKDLCIKKHGATTITITHDMRGATYLADEIAMIYEGNFVFHDNIEKVADSDNKYLKQFMNGDIDGPIAI